MDFAATAYLWLFWPMVAVAIWRSLRTCDPSLLRAAMIAGLGQFGLEFFRELGTAQAWYAYVAMYAVSIVWALWRPSSRFLVVFAGANIAGFVLAVIGSISVPDQGSQAFKGLWSGLYIVAVAELAILMWGCNCGILDRVWRSLRRIFVFDLGDKSRTGDLP